MPQISQRSRQFSESVIRRMTRVAEKYQAINLSQGFPDFDPPESLLNSLKRVAETGPHQYEITFGSQTFREALARKQSVAIGRSINPETEVVVTCGATEAMICAMMAVINPGDRVGVFSPYYENYAADAILTGAEAVFIPLHPPEYQVDWDCLEEAFADGIKAMVVCNPSNPCGKVFTKEELLRIGQLARMYGVWVITDEVYEHIVYAPYTHTCMASLPGMWQNTLTVSSLSETYSITGWRLGYLIGPEEAVDAARKVHDFLTVGAAAPLQAAAVPGLLADQAYYHQLLDLYTQKRSLFLEGLKRVGIGHTQPQGTYFVLADIGPFLDLPKFSGFDDTGFCEWMAQHIGVAAVPGSSFFPDSSGDRMMRLHFARGQDSLKEAVRRLERLGSL